MKLLITTGGEGKRLYPLTKNIPKPMIEIAGKPVLHHLVDWATSQGIEEIIMLNGYLSEKITGYFKDGKNFGIKITHSNEPFPLGTGGAIKMARKHIKEIFVYITGDHICDVNLRKMVNFHKKNKADMTTFVHESTHPEDSDILIIDSKKEVKELISKDKKDKRGEKLSNSGLCIVNTEILNLMDEIKEEKFDFEKEIYPKAISSGKKILAYITDEFMADTGTFERLKKCEEYLKSK